MDNIRIFLWVALAMMAWLVIQAWQQDYPPPTSTSNGMPDHSTDAGPSPPPATLPALPDAGSAAASTAPAPVAALGAAIPAAGTVHVRTDVLDLQLTLAGADINSLALPAYPVHKDQPNVPVELLTVDKDRFFQIHTGLRAADGRAEASHLSVFTAAQPDYVLGPGDDELLVPLRWDSGTGLTVDKIFHFRRGHYDIEVEYRISNQTTEPYRIASYLQVERAYQKPQRSYFDVESYSFKGPVAYDGTKYQKLDPEKFAAEPFSQTVTKGWIAAIQHHFLAAAVPAPMEPFRYEGAFAEGRFRLSAISPLQSIEPGSTGNVSAKLFVGPKLQGQLTDTAEGLQLTADYGRLTLLAQPLFWILQKIHSVVGNWGWSIILCTFLIKLVFYKLTETSGRSMARMRKLQPRLKALQDRYKDDRQAMSTALMDLYKREKVNPAAGCLPMVVQIPFFISFYWVLLESVEMRQAPFALWITDLSSRDPFFILPLLMGAAMFLQQKLNPAPPDPVQAKIMQVMPVMFTGFFAFFPAGLVLYWLTNSVLSILQQWRINKVLGAE